MKDIFRRVVCMGGLGEVLREGRKGRFFIYFVELGNDF